MAGASGPILPRWGQIYKVFINPAILKTATFLTINDQPNSTVFFVRWQLADDSPAYYAVTTRHSIGEVVQIRFNKKGGGVDPLWFSSQDWIKHASTDVAVLPLKSGLDGYDIGYVEASDFADDKDYLVAPTSPDTPAAHSRLGLPYAAGDEVFTVGLFEGHAGQGVAQPVARFGHIALRPSEGETVLAEIELGRLAPIDALLVEMAVWKGQSGSPVFLRVGEQSRAFRDGLERHYLVGMIQGFYPGTQDVKINDSDATLSPLQMGIGIVVPARDIKEALTKTMRESQ